MRPPRLDPALYLGLKRYFLTLCTAQRQEHFTEVAHTRRVYEQIVQCSARFDIAVIAYCFMPDHAHLLVEGCREESNVLTFVHRAKQVSGYDFARRTDQRLWQPGFHDRILRHDTATLSVIRYIFENPVRAGLVEAPEEYPLLGSDRFTIAEVLEATQWRP